MTRLVGALDVWRTHLRNQNRWRLVRPSEDQIHEFAEHMVLGGAGVFRPYPTGLVEAAQGVLNRRAADLNAATLYVVSPSMCDVIVAAAQTLTLDDLALLTPADLPSPTGMIMLPFPLLVRTTGGGLGDDRAYVWHTPAQIDPPPPLTHASPPPQNAVRVTSYMDTQGPVTPDSFLDMAQVAAADGTPSRRCCPTRPAPTRSNPKSPTRPKRHPPRSPRSRGTRATGGASASVISPLDEGDNLTDTRSFTYRPGDEIDDHDDHFALRFLYAFWRLCGQRIAELADLETNHSARVQAERAGVSAHVRVVAIRPTHRDDPPREAAGRDWQHRWIVRMHKVRQWYPTEQRHKILYRGPYIKGPADKPALRSQPGSAGSDPCR